MLDAAIAVAQRYEGEVIALSVVEVPDRELLYQGVEPARQMQNELDLVVDTLRPKGVPITTLVKISHRISFGIIETALDEAVDI